MPSEWQDLEPTRTRVHIFTVNHEREKLNGGGRGGVHMRRKDRFFLE